MANILIFQAVLEAIKEGSKAYSTWLKSREKRRLELCKDAAERYIMVNEKEGEYKDITEEQKKKYLVHFRKRFVVYN